MFKLSRTRITTRTKFQNFQKRNKTRLYDSKTRTQNVHDKHEDEFYYANVCKHEHEKNLTRLLCKIMPKNRVEQTKRNEGSYSYLYPFGDLVQGSFQGGFYVCIK